VQALVIGQVTIILLALLAGAWVAVKTERQFLAGSLLALAAWIKIFPALVIVYFLWKRDWRVVRGALVSGIALGVLQIALSGFAPMIDMVNALFSLTSAGQDWWVFSNASVFGFASQVFGAHATIVPLVTSPALSLISRAALTLGLIGGLFYVTRGKDQRGFDAEYGLAVLTSLLISPTLYPTSLLLSLLTFFLLIRSRPTRRMIGFCTAACLILSLYCLFAFNYSGDPPLHALVLSFGFYTLMATWGVSAWVLLQRLPRTHAPSPLAPLPRRRGEGNKDTSIVGE
jgi:hypothetical protein